MDSFPNIEDAEFYHNNSLQQWSVAQYALDNFSLSGHERILDLGSGSGRLTAHLAERVQDGEVVGVDISKGMIEFAKRQFIPFFSNLSFEQCSILDISYADDFDVVCCFSALHWCNDLQQALSRTFQALRSNGRLVATLPTEATDDILLVRRKLENHPRWASYLAEKAHPRIRHSVNECEQFLKSAGFSSYTVCTVEHNFMFENRRALADWFASFSPRVMKIPRSKREEFLVDFVKTYLDVIPLKKTGEIPFQFNEIHMQAMRA